MERHVSRVTELISGEDGELNEAGLEDFTNSVKLHERGISYFVVSIIGPHNSGKSSLLNQLFGTRFKQRDRNTEWGVPVTSGVWIAKAAGEEPFTLVLDLEGADSLLRGQDDTAFEKQSALFALAVADIVLINTWAKDFGREHGAIRPLLRTIFQEAVMMPEFHPRKTTLFLVVRDMSPHDPPLLKESADKDIQKIWEEARKPRGHEDASLDKFFNVEIFALYDCRERKEEFEGQVEEVRKKYLISEYRQRILNSVSDEDRQRILNSVSDKDRQQILNSVSDEDRRGGIVPASGFCLSIKDKWATIKRNKSLDLPAHMFMVSTTMCVQIAEEKLGLFKSNQVWRRLQQAAEISFDAAFGSKISTILNEYLSEYDSESLYFDQDVRNSKREEYLKSRALMLVHPAYIKNLGHLRSQQFQSFKTQLQEDLDLKRFAESARRCQQSCVEEFVRQCSGAAVEEARWDDDASTERQQLVRDIENHKLLVTAEALHRVVNECRDLLCREFNGNYMNIWSCSIENLSWEFIRRFLSDKSDAPISEFRSAVEISFELEQTKVEQKVNDMRQYARQLVGNYFRYLNSETVVEMMTWRYYRSYLAQTQLPANEDSTSSSFKKKKKDSTSSVHETACLESLKILSIVAAIRLDEGDDNIESVLVSALMHGGVQPPQDPLDATKWPQLPPQVIALITPTDCKDIWNKFKETIGESFLPTAQNTHEAMSSAAGNGWVPPAWVIVGLLALGITAFLLFLRFSNLDVLLVVLYAVCQGITLVIPGLKSIKNVGDVMGKKNIDFYTIRSKHSKLMKDFEKCLRKFYRQMQNRSSAKVAAY